MQLGDYGEPLAYEIAFWLEGVEDPNYPLADMGDLCVEVSESLRVLAIIALLSKADRDRFAQNLVRSGQVRVSYLERLQRERVAGDHHQGSGRYEPLLDAVAGGALDVARSIGALSAQEWQEGREYEEDYCYGRILALLVEDPPVETEARALLPRFERALDGADSARLVVCRSILDRDQLGFDESFEALLAEREAQIRDDKERGQTEEPPVIAQRRVFVEGVALLRIAERFGLTTQAEYRFCPLLARRQF